MSTADSASQVALREQLIVLAAAARQGIERMSLEDKLASHFDGFPRGACGPASELMGRIVLEHTGHLGTYVCGEGHPRLRAQQSHAWLEVNGLLVDLTHDQFSETGLTGWVFEGSPWHSAFNWEKSDLCLDPKNWGSYPVEVYAAMKRSCNLTAYTGRTFG